MTTTVSEQEADVFDLSRFAAMEAKFNDYARISAVKDYLRGISNELDIEHMEEAVNPVRLFSRVLEGPNINSHGELELLVTDTRKDLFDYKQYGSTPFRRINCMRKGAVLCIDTQKSLPFDEINYHPQMFLRQINIFGNVRRSLEADRYIPGHGLYFIEIGALCYNDIGNTWAVGVYGKNFKSNGRAEE